MTSLEKMDRCIINLEKTLNDMINRHMLMRKHNIEIYTTSSRAKTWPLPDDVTENPNANQGSTTMAFLCKILVSCSLTNPPYHNYCRLTLVSPLSLAHTRLKRPSRGLQHVQLFDQTRQGKHLIHAASILIPILAQIFNSAFVEALQHMEHAHDCAHP